MDIFGNREGLLPEEDRRTWYECDVNHDGWDRGAERIVFSAYGRNLDALWDCLGDMQGEIVLCSSGKMLKALGPCGKRSLPCFPRPRSACRG